MSRSRSSPPSNSAATSTQQIRWDLTETPTTGGEPATDDVSAVIDGLVDHLPTAGYPKNIRMTIVAIAAGKTAT